MTQPAAFLFRDNVAALAAARELGSAGTNVVVFDAQPGPAARSRYSTFIETPSYYDDPRGCAEAIAAHAGGADPAPVLFPTEDAALLVVHLHADVLADRVCLSYAAGPAQRLLDKRELYRLAAACGVAAPHWHAVDHGSPADACVDVGPDWIAKPACRYWPSEDGGRIRTFLSLTGGSKAIGAEQALEAARRVREAGFPAIVQERIPGPFEDLLSVGLVVAPDGKLVAHFCARKRCEYPEPFGDGLIVEAIACNEDLVEAALAVLRRAGYWGLADVEFKLDPRDGAYKLLDINPRVWLWLGLGARAGAPLARIAYAQAAGLPWAPARPDPARAVPWVSLRGAAGFLLGTWNPGRHGWGRVVEVTAGAARSAVVDFFRYRDPVGLRPATWAAALRSLARRKR